MSLSPKQLQALFHKQRPSLQADSAYAIQRTQGQTPHVLIISCCDSRTDPARLFNAPFGTLFTYRNIANIVQPYGQDAAIAAAIAFAVEHVGITDIIILGHSDCAGIKGVCQHDALQGDLAAFLAPAAAERSSTSTAALPDSITTPHDQQALRTLICSHQHLQTYPVVKQALAQKKLRTHAWFYDMQTIALWQYDTVNDCFRNSTKDSY